MTKFNILHIDVDTGWRGGQQQGFYLHKELSKKGINSCFICQPGSSLEKKCRKENLNFKTVKMHGEIDVFAGKKIADFCKKNDFNILHLHDAHAMAIGLYASLFNNRLKLIGVRRVDYHIKKNFFSRLKYKSPRMTKLVAISNEIKRVMLEDGIDENRIEVIKSGVDLTKYHDIKKSTFLFDNYDIPNHAFIVGTIAALAGHKDYPNLLHSAKEIISKNNNIYFVALGDGPDKQEILKLYSDLDLKDRFIFTGFKKDVGNHLKNFDIFVLASHKEGLGTSVIDAMAAGIPCVCCNSGGIPELIDNEENGLLVEKRNAGLLSEAILRLYNDKNLRKKFMENGLSKSVNFSIAKNFKGNIKLYEKLVS